MRVVYWIIALPVLAIAMAFAVSNPQSVTLELWPLPYQLAMPLYAAVAGSLFIGFVVGALYGWIGGMRARHRATSEAKRADRLAMENAELGRKLRQAETAPRLAPPAPAPPYIQQTALRHIAAGNSE